MPEECPLTRLRVSPALLQCADSQRERRLPRRDLSLPPTPRTPLPEIRSRAGGLRSALRRLGCPSLPWPKPPRTHVASPCCDTTLPLLSPRFACRVPCSPAPRA